MNEGKTALLTLKSTHKTQQLGVGLCLKFCPLPYATRGSFIGKNTTLKYRFGWWAWLQFVCVNSFLHFSNGNSKNLSGFWCCRPWGLWTLIKWPQSRHERRKIVWWKKVASGVWVWYCIVYRQLLQWAHCRAMSETSDFPRACHHCDELTNKHSLHCALQTCQNYSFSLFRTWNRSEIKATTPSFRKTCPATVFVRISIGTVLYNIFMICCAFYSGLPFLPSSALNPWVPGPKQGDRNWEEDNLWFGCLGLVLHVILYKITLCRAILVSQKNSTHYRILCYFSNPFSGISSLQ